LPIPVFLIPFLRIRKFAEPHDSYGNSANLATSLKNAYNTGAKRIFLVEDDIIVSPDIFEWHEAVLDDANPFVSCATALNKSAHFQINGPQAMDESYQDPSAYLKVCGPYSSHAAAFKRENLGRLLDKLAHPGVKWEPGREQDLLTQELMRDSMKQGGKVLVSAWPYVPRAYNCGWYSYHINTGMRFNGTLDEKVRALERTIRDRDKLREMSANNAVVTAIPEQWPNRMEPVKNMQRFR
jgi:hypothetical protein